MKMKCKSVLVKIRVLPNVFKPVVSCRAVTLQKLSYVERGLGIGDEGYDWKTIWLASTIFLKIAQLF